MANKTKQLLYLSFAAVLFAVSVVLIVVSTVNSIRYGQYDFSHNLVIKEVKSDTDVETNGILHHNAILNGGITNNTDKDYIMVQVQVVLAGVNNKTGEYAETVSIFVIEEFDSNRTIDLTNESIKVGDRNGFVPESIKEIKLVIDSKECDVNYEDVADVYLLLFAVALASLFGAGFLASKWWTMKNPIVKTIEIKKEINDDEIEEDEEV